MTFFKPEPHRVSSNDAALNQFRSLCDQMRKEGRELPDQAALDALFLTHERKADCEYHRERLRQQVRTALKRKAPSAAAKQLAQEFSEASGRDFSAGDVAIGDVFAKAVQAAQRR